MRSYVSPRNIIIDKSFYEASIKLLEERNRHPERKIFHIDDFRKIVGPRTESALIEMNARNLCSRADKFDKTFEMQPETVNQDYLHGCRCVLKEWKRDELWSDIRAWLGVMGFILSIVSLAIQLFS